MAGDTRDVDKANSIGRAEGGAWSRNGAHSSVIYRFGPYELDPKRHELRLSGRRLRLAPAPLDLLLFLIEGRESLVKREEIAARLWSQPNLVDIDQGINTAIRRVREVLLDDPTRPRFVETIVGKGYRFIAHVEEVERELRVKTAVPAAIAPQLLPIAEILADIQPLGIPASASGAAAQASSTLLRQLRSAIRRSAPIGLALALILVGGFIGRRHYRRSRIISAGSLTQITTNDSEQRVTAAAISPDGKWIAYADSTGLSLRVLESGETIALETPDNFRAEKIAWYPDQLKILVSGFAADDAVPEVWTVFIVGALPQLFLKNARNGMPSPDGTHTLFTRNADQEIWVSGFDGDGGHPLIIGASGEYFPAVFWSPDSRRVSFLKRSKNLVQADYQSVDAHSGRTLASERSLDFDAACALRDGRILFLHNTIGSIGSAYVVQVVNSDSATGAFFTSPRTIFSFDRARTSGLTSSDDGKRWSVVIEKGEPHVYVGTLQQPGPSLTEVQRLTFDTRTDYPHAWLRDSQTAIFESNRTGTYRLYQQHLQDRTAHEFNTGEEPAVLPQVTPDGKWLLFAKKPNVTPSSKDKLYRIPISGGPASQVPIGGPLDEFACPLTGKYCVLRETLDKKSFIYFSLDPVSGKGRELARIAWLPHMLADWAVSPDGSMIAIPSHDPGKSTIKLVPLDNSTEHEREVVVKGFGKLAGLNWSADGQGWYVASDTDVGTALLYVDKHGNSHVLRNTPRGTWGVPSPDGRKLAFVDQSVDSNVWMWQSAAGR